jgi:hypothetical protein
LRAKTGRVDHRVKLNNARIAAAELHLPLPRLKAHPLDRRFERDHAAAIFQFAPQRTHVSVAVDDAGFRRKQRADAGELGLHGAGGIAADHLDTFDAIRLRLRQDGLDLGQFRLVGGDDELAAFAVRHAVRRAEVVEQAPAAHAVDRAQRAGRVIKAAMDHFRVARRHAVGDAAGRLGHGHVVAAERRGARDRQPNHAGADHQNLHRASTLMLSRLRETTI